MSELKHSDTGFILYKHWDNQISLLSLEQKGRLFEAILNYQCRNEEFETDDMLLKMLWTGIKQSFEHNNKKYEEMCERNRENARKRWNKENAVACERMPSDAVDADIDKEIEKEKEIDIDIDIEKEKEIDAKNYNQKSKNNSENIISENSQDKKEEEKEEKERGQSPPSNIKPSLLKHMKEYDFSVFSNYELTTPRKSFLYKTENHLTIAEFEMLKDMIISVFFVRYLLRLETLKDEDAFAAMIKWAKDDHAYIGQAYELHKT